MADFDPLAEHVGRARRALMVWVGLAAANVFVWWKWFVHENREQTPMWSGLFIAFGLSTLVSAVVAVVYSIRGKSWLWGILAGLSGVGGVVVWLAGGLLGLLATSSGGFGFGGGGAWGRPLRVRGRQLHPELREGSDWTDGERPSPAGLDPATRAALEALWLHDAQKEHASVPAFSRVSWLLAAVGAPAPLLEWAHRAALEEIAHTRLCFALAAGYAGRSYTVEPMPELLLGGLGLDGDALTTLAIESLTDGCQLEDFNADVAAACARVCEEPVTRRVLEQIAREERSHADFSWAVVEWLLTRDRRRAERAIENALVKLIDYQRPTAVAATKQALVGRADGAALRRHGRLPDHEWAAAWDARLVATRARVASLLATTERKAA